MPAAPCSFSTIISGSGHISHDDVHVIKETLLINFLIPFLRASARARVDEVKFSGIAFSSATSSAHLHNVRSLVLVGLVCLSVSFVFKMKIGPLHFRFSKNDLMDRWKGGLRTARRKNGRIKKNGTEGPLAQGTRNTFNYRESKRAKRDSRDRGR